MFRILPQNPSWFSGGRFNLWQRREGERGWKGRREMGGESFKV